MPSRLFQEYRDVPGLPFHLLSVKNCQISALHHYIPCVNERDKWRVVQCISLLKNAVKNSTLRKKAWCYMILESSEPIGKEIDSSAMKCGQSTPKQPKRRQIWPVLASDEASFRVFSANASGF